MRVLVRGPVDTSSGYGGDVVGLTLELFKMGVDVTIWPTAVVPGLPDQVLRLMRQPLSPPYDLVLWYCSPAEMAPRGMPGFGRTVLGWTMWERDRVEPEDLMLDDAGLADLADGVWLSRRPHLDRRAPVKAWLDGLIVTCPMNVSAFRQVEQYLPIEVIPPGVVVDKWPVVSRGPGPEVVFGAVGVMTARKDPAALLEAWTLFRRHHPELKARLIVKAMASTMRHSEVELLPDVSLLLENLTQEEMASWYGSLDVLVSASRGEGMNKPAVEFMATGGPVIATSWGGHENWMMPSLGYEVTHRMAPAAGGRGDALDAPVVVESLAEQMYAAAVDPLGRRKKGMAAARFVRSGLSWRHAAERLLVFAGRFG